jgi:hypothetical protein
MLLIVDILFYIILYVIVGLFATVVFIIINIKYNNIFRFSAYDYDNVDYSSFTQVMLFFWPLLSLNMVFVLLCKIPNMIIRYLINNNKRH